MVMVRVGTVGGALLLALALFSLAGVAGAAPGGAEAKRAGEVSGQGARTRSIDRAVALMERHMEVEGGRLVLDRRALSAEVARGEAAGIAAGTLGSLEAALRRTNGRIEAGETTAAEVFPSGARPVAEGIAALRRCDGINGTVYRWWGYRSYLNDCVTHTLIRGLLLGAGANAIAAAAGWVPGGLIGPIMAIGVVVIDGVDERGGHDGVYFTKVYGVGTTVWHQ